SQRVWRMVEIGQTRAESGDGRGAGKALERIQRAGNHLRLILDLVDRHLLPGVAHEFPPRIARGPSDATVFSEDASAYGQGRADSQPREKIEETPDATRLVVFLAGPVRGT